MWANKKWKDVAAVYNEILLGLVWQSNITQGWHTHRAVSGEAVGWTLDAMLFYLMFSFMSLLSKVSDGLQCF